jgi:hypothetical protein
MKLFSFQTRQTTGQPGNMNQFIMNLRPNILPQPVVVSQQVVVTPSPEKKVKWGPAIWFLLHTLSIKIREDRFKSIRVELINHIYSICTNLPCPICSQHAKGYLNGINFNTIQTKDDLKRLLWAFHNEVNQLKGYPFFTFDQIDEKYSTAVTNNIIVYFMAHFSDRSRSVKLMADDLIRSHLCKVLKEWFNQNITAFDP